MAAILGLGLGGAITVRHILGDSVETPRPAPELTIGPNGEKRSERHDVELDVDRPTRVRDILDGGDVSFDAARIEGGSYVQLLADGRRVTLTAWPEVQKRAVSMMSQHKIPYGAVVVMDPRTGDVLALAEHSSVAPDHTGLPLAATQPSASIFKVITSAALIEEADITPGTRRCVRGGGRGITEDLLRANRKRDTKCVTFEQALAKSTNTFFARMADQHLDRVRLDNWANRFGYNRKIPFIWDVQQSWARFPKDRVERAGAAAGFHYTKLSPLHAALIAATVANGGEMPEPHIVARVEKGGVVSYRSEPYTLMRPISEKTAATLGEMMVATTTEGTALKYFSRRAPGLREMRIAGKTGSLSSSALGGVRRKNSWFVGFAPADAPRVAIAALVVDDPSWRLKSTHLAREVLETWAEASESRSARAAKAKP